MAKYEWSLTTFDHKKMHETGSFMPVETLTSLKLKPSHWNKKLIFHSEILKNKLVKITFQTFNKLKHIHWLNSSAQSSFFEKGIILTKPFQSSQSRHQLSFFEKGIIVQNFLLSEWALVFWNKTN